MLNYRNSILAGLLAVVSGMAQAGQLQGSVQWWQRAEMGTPVSGVIDKVAVQPGQTVAKGAQLVALDQRPFQARLARDRAELERLELVLAEAQRELERQTEMYQRAMLSEHDMQIAEIAYADAKNRYTAAQSALRLTEVEADYSTLEAPFDGIVITVDAAPGEAVVSGVEVKPLVSVGATGRYRAVAAAKADELKGLKAGAGAHVSVAGKRYSGTIEQVGVEPDADNRYPVSIVFSSKGAVIPIGTKATLELP